MGAFAEDAAAEFEGVGDGARLHAVLETGLEADDGVFAVEDAVGAAEVDGAAANGRVADDAVVALVDRRAARVLLAAPDAVGDVTVEERLQLRARRDATLVGERGVVTIEDEAARG